jgi:Plavaka transposase
MHDFPRADIYELIAPDLLHQVIQGMFKDHLIMWVEEYLIITHGKTDVKDILDDMNRQ